MEISKGARLVELTVNVFSRRSFRFGWGNDPCAAGQAFIMVMREEDGAQIEMRSTCSVG